MDRKIIDMSLNINGRCFEQLIIDQHYKRKHSATITDEIIVALMMSLDGRSYDPQHIHASGFSYFVNDDLLYQGRRYKLIWLTHLNENYVGVVNAYRRK